jgi:glycosyl hydrolase family 42 (putative beta-galactosidase)
MKWMPLLSLALLLATGTTLAADSSPGASSKETLDPNAIWIEGEDADVKQVTHHGWYHGSGVKKDGMSGEEWLSHYDSGKPGLAEFRFAIRKERPYVLWMRVNPFQAKLSYKLDAGPWKAIDTSGGNLRGRFQVTVRPDHRALAWVKVGQFDLAEGSHTLAVRLDGGISHSTAIDCLTFAAPDFVPSGTQRPTVQTGLGEPGEWFKVLPDDDTFSDRSITDLSELIPAPAGQFGFLQRNGKDLKFSNAAQAVKFWGVCSGPNREYSREQLTRKIRLMRKHGINMVRQHPVTGVVGWLRNGQFDRQRIDHFDWWFAELKKHGLYMTWSVFYPLRISEDSGYPRDLLRELSRGSDGRYSTSGVVNFSRPLQDLQIAYVRKLLDHVNPYTGLAYKDDPALAVLEMHNEDCIFFHSPLNTLTTDERWPKHTAMFQRMWRNWAKEKYGDDAALRRAWGTDDSFSRDRFGTYGGWQMDHDRRNVRSKKRLGDFIEFCTGLQRDYYDRRYREYREAGYKGTIVTTAWHAGGEIANPANLYCDNAGDMIDRHNYFGGGAGGHNITAGKVNNGTHMGMPGGGIPSIGLFQVEDKPFSCTEWTQLPPNQYKAEIAPLFAFYGMGLQGWDASYHFAFGENRMGSGWPRLRSYVTETPHYLGQFPALALAIYKGHVEEAPIAAARRLKLADLYTGDDPLGTAYSAHGGTGADMKTARGEKTPNEALAIGRVTVSFDGGKSENTEWDRYWDRGRKTVRSMTGQLEWDYGRRVAVLRGPKTHAVIGFAGGGKYDLPGASIDVRTPFVSLILTPLDDQPLERSGHILITAMARDKQTNTQYNDAGTELLQVGGPPLLMEPVQATIHLKGPAPTNVCAVDIYGVPTDREVQVENDGSFVIDGRYRTYYYEVKR